MVVVMRVLRIGVMRVRDGEGWCGRVGGVRVGVVSVGVERVMVRGLGRRE